MRRRWQKAGPTASNRCLKHSIHVHAALTVNWTGDQEAAWSAALADNGGQAVGTVLHRRGLPTRLAEVSFPCFAAFAAVVMRMLLKFWPANPGRIGVRVTTAATRYLC